MTFCQYQDEHMLVYQVLFLLFLSLHPIQLNLDYKKMDTRIAFPTSEVTVPLRVEGINFFGPKIYI